MSRTRYETRENYSGLKKASGSVIGKQVKYVPERELSYHEILSICNAFRNITNGVIVFRDIELRHQFSDNFNLQLILEQ